MPSEATVYVPGADVRAAWAAWNDTLAARCEHELACFQARRGCDLAGAYCIVGLDLHEAEQDAHREYRTTVGDLGVRAA